MFFRKRHTKQDLEKLFHDYALSIGQCAHLAIDVQPPFCNSYRRLTNNITGVIAPSFNKVSVPTYWIYMGDRDCLDPRVKIAANDRAMRKDLCSAFIWTNLDTQLKAQDKKVIFISGLFSEVCVNDTALDAREQGYHVVLMPDGIDKGEVAWEKRMLKKDVRFVNSDVALCFLRDLE